MKYKKFRLGLQNFEHVTLQVKVTALTELISYRFVGKDVYGK